MNNLNTLKQGIQKANEDQIDGLWAILKYREIGILRKLKSMSALLGLKSEQVISEAPQDEDQRILDYNTRKEIHETLIKQAQN